MKFLLVVSLSLLSSLAFAEDFAAGVILGDPSGLSVKMKMDEGHSLDGAFAYSSGKHHGIQFHADYLRDRARSWHTSGGGPINMYYGIGGRIISYDDSKKSEVAIGPRGSLGLNYDFFNPNVEVFGELALVLEVAPSVDADIDFGVGARIRF